MEISMNRSINKLNIFFLMLFAFSVAGQSDLFGEWRCVEVLRGHEGYVFSVAISRDGRRIFSGSSDRTIKEWDLTKDRCL